MNRTTATARVVISPLGQSPAAARRGSGLARIADAGIDQLCTGDHVSFWVGIGSEEAITATSL
jgi:hypothetical protein